MVANLVQVKTIKEFTDREADMKIRKKDDEFEVSEKRAKYLATLHLVEIVKRKNRIKTEILSTLLFVRCFCFAQNFDGIKS